MSVIDAPAKPIFGSITIEQMRAHEALIPTVMPLVHSACKHSKGRFDVDRVFDGLIRGGFRMWGVMTPPAKLESIAVTTLHAEPGGRVFDILMVGPSFDTLFKFLPVLSNAGRAQGCARMRLTGPPFWGKKYLPEEWRQVACIYEQDLSADGRPKDH